MELFLVLLVPAAWLHGYVRGRRRGQVVELSARDLRRELRRRK